MKPLSTPAHPGQDSISTPKKAIRDMALPKLTSRQWIALIVGAFIALLLFSQAVAPQASSWVITKAPYDATPQQAIATNPNSDISLDISQVVAGSPTPHFRGKPPTSCFLSLKPEEILV